MKNVVLSDADTRGSSRPAILIAVASIVIFIYGMLASMLGTIVPSLGIRLSLTNAEISYLALAQGIGLAGTSVWAGTLMEKRGKKIGVVLGLCASVLGLLILTHPGTLLLGIVAMAILGMGGSLVIVGANVIVNDVSENRKAAALNFLNIFVGLGGMATPFVAGNLLQSDSVKVAWCGAGIAAIALILTLATPIRNPAPAEAAVRHASVFRNSTLYILALVTFLYTACEFGIWNWLPRFLIASGVPDSTALNILSLGFACGILLGRLGAAKLLGKASPLAVTVLAAVGMGITTFAMLRTTSPAITGVVVFLAGISMAPIFPTTIAIIGKLFKQGAPTAIGFAITCGFSGLVLSSPVIGWLSGAEPSGIGNGLLMIPILAFVIAGLLLFFRKSLAADNVISQA